MKSVDKSTKFVLKTPKGTRDFTPALCTIRNQVFEIIRTCFEQFGAQEIDTPVFETKETLVGQYGEDSKLIYDLADQQGEILSLRYDLTVPFARYVAQNNLDKMKRFHIAKVYRRDNPSIVRGRYREFYQCDFDIAGIYGSMIPDTECVNLMITILKKLDIGKFRIKLNHRKIIDGIMSLCGVPNDKIRSISSSIDKIDKLPWEKIYEEMTVQKNLPGEVALKIKNYIELNGDISIIKNLTDSTNKDINTSIVEGCKDLILLDDYLKSVGAENFVIYDLSLVRGIDYYTGVIYEAVLEEQFNDQKYNNNQKSPPGTVPINKESSGSKDSDNQQLSALGSIAAGGRYDNLVGMFSKRNKQVPCVGVSIGIERIFGLIEKKYNKDSKVRTSKTQVFVATMQKNMVKERFKLTNLLREEGFYPDTDYRDGPKLLNQLQYCEENSIPFCIIIGSDELENNTVKLKDTRCRQEITIPRDSLVSTLRQALIDDKLTLS